MREKNNGFNGRTTYFSNYERRTKMEANEIMTNEEVGSMSIL